MKSSIIGTLFLVTCAMGCQKDVPISPTPSATSSPLRVIGRDSIYSGSYLSIGVNQAAQQVYTVVQSLRQTKGVSYLNVVSNTSSDLTQLRDRLPLYQYILLDQRQGTASGVQITISSDRVASIYLNSGQKLSQWPMSVWGTSSIRLGDPASALYDKFVRIRAQRSYTPTFERILLLTKNLSSAYDPVMGQSPQWYFTYQPAPKQMDEVQLHFKGGKVSYLIVTHYQS